MSITTVFVSEADEGGHEEDIDESQVVRDPTLLLDNALSLASNAS